MPHHDGENGAPTHAPIKIKLPAGVGRLGLSSRVLTVAGAGAVAVVMITAAVALATSGGDKPADAAAKPASQDNSYRIPVGELLENGSLPRPSLQGDQSDKGVPAGTAPRPTAPAATPATPGAAGEIATYSGGSGTLTPAGIATLAIKAGCSASAAVVATAIAIAESGGSPSAQGDTTLMDGTWDWSAGLWQIRGLKAQRNTGQLRDSIANHNPATNAAAMYEISGGCTNWGPWTTYTRGTYQSFMGIARRAVEYIERYRRGHDGALPPVAAPDPNAPVPAGGSANGGAASTRRPSGTAGRPSSTPVRSSAPGGNQAPTNTPRRSPTLLPTKLPTLLPTKLPTLLPTKLPTRLPTLLPTKLPTKLPTLLPTKLPILG